MLRSKSKTFTVSYYIVAEFDPSRINDLITHWRRRHGFKVGNANMFDGQALN